MQTSNKQKIPGHEAATAATVALHILTGLIALSATFFRILLAIWRGVWYDSGQIDDDVLLIAYANLKRHFEHPNTLSMMKTMSYPFFLNIVSFLKVNYVSVLAVVWILTALLAVLTLRHFTKSRLFLTFVYLYVLFTPAAFNSWTGTRLYRNSIIAPFVYQIFLLIVLISVHLVRGSIASHVKAAVCSLLMGILFSFAYYIKEDGIWLLGCLLFFTGVTFVLSLIRSFRWLKGKRIGAFLGSLLARTAILLLPICLFFAATSEYKALNKRYFSVSEVSTKTEGGLGTFVSIVNTIDAADRTAIVWTPYEAIDQAFKHSETLQKYPQLEEAIIKTPWYHAGDIRIEPIKGDFLSWVMRNALKDTGIWKDESQVDRLFKQVNKELKAAFASGSLKKSDRIYLTTSMGGRTKEEIRGLADDLRQAVRGLVLLDGYTPDIDSASYDNPHSIADAEKLTGLRLFHSTQEEHAYRTGRTGRTATAVITRLFAIYRILNCLLLLVLATGLIRHIVSCIAKKDRFFRLAPPFLATGYILALLAIICVYLFAICWFTEFIFTGGTIIKTILNFYTIGAVPLFSLTLLLGGALLLKSASKPAKESERQE